MNKANVIQLPEPNTEGTMTLEEAITQRRSVRRYTEEQLSERQIGQLLWAAQGVTGRTPSKRAAPSAGALHPLEFYVCRFDGVWRYHPKQHVLQRHSEQDVRRLLGEAAWKQAFVGDAPCVFLTTAVYHRSTGRYGERGRVRYVPMDLGHAAENLLLQAVALGLGAVPVGAFDDHAVEEAVDLPHNEEPLYLISVGYPV